MTAKYVIFNGKIWRVSHLDLTLPGYVQMRDCVENIYTQIPEEVVKIYYDTWDDAHTYMMEAALGQVEQTKKSLEIAQERLLNVMSLTDPYQ